MVKRMKHSINNIVQCWGRKYRTSSKWAHTGWVKWLIGLLRRAEVHTCR